MNNKNLNIYSNYNFVTSTKLSEKVGAFPISINNIPLSYNTSDITRFSVSFSYIRYTRERHNTTQSVNSFPLGGLSEGDIVGVVNIGNGLFRIQRLLNGQIITEVSSSKPTL